MQRTVAFALFGLALCISLGSDGQTLQSPYPIKPVKVLVPFQAGGVPDVIARMLAQELSARLGQQFVVENRVGAGGSIALAYVAKSPADGYTLLVSSRGPLTILPHVAKTREFDVFKDFAPISILGSSVFYVVACPKHPLTTLSDLASYAHRQPLTYPSAGYGSETHIAGAILNQRLGINMTHIPYKGVPLMMTDLISCNVDLGFGAYGTVLQFIKTGKLKALAVSSKNREPETPEVPTLKELGFDYLDVVLLPWYGILAPANTPQFIIDKLHAATVDILKMESFQDRLRVRGITGISSKTPKDFSMVISEEFKRMEKIVREGKIVAE